MKLICVHGVCSPEECHQCLRERASAEAERAAVVRYLRHGWIKDPGRPHEIADAIERGDHLKETP